MKKNKRFIGVTVLLIVAVVIAVIIRNAASKAPVTSNNTQTPTTQTTLEKNDFKLTAQYTATSTWSYRITGSLPNPCYTTKNDAVVAESYPEQVSVKLTVTKPAADTICAQVIKDVDLMGSFSASDKANISFDVIEN